MHHRTVAQTHKNTQHAGVETAGSKTGINLGRWRASGANGDIKNNCRKWRMLLAGEAMSSVTSGNAGAGRSGDVSDGAGAGEWQQNRQRHGGAATLRQPHPRHTLLVAMFF